MFRTDVLDNLWPAFVHVFVTVERLLQQIIVKGTYIVHTLLVRSFLQTWPKKKWQGSSLVTTVACTRLVLLVTILSLMRSLSTLASTTKSLRLDTRTKESHMCSSFFCVKRTSAMKVNVHVHLQSTVVLRMASFQSTPHTFYSAARATVLPITGVYFSDSLFE